MVPSIPPYVPLDELKRLDARIRAGKGDNNVDWAGRSTALLCLGRYPEALEGYQKANELAGGGLSGEKSLYLEDIGLVYWLMGERRKAIETFKEAVDGILDHSIKYADLAGGATQGLLLWYAGITEKDKDVTDFALSYLKKLAKKPRIKYWPGPLALMALGKKSFDQVLREHPDFGTADLDQLVKKAKGDPDLVQSLFYFACSKRQKGKEKECHVLMVKCARLENPILGLEWFLADAESKKGKRRWLQSKRK